MAKLWEPKLNYESRQVVGVSRCAPVRRNEEAEKGRDTLRGSEYAEEECNDQRLRN
jgi:hypothetical protein